MKRTIVVCSYNRPIQAQTQDIINKMVKLGAAYVPQTGSADVALARNFALTGACVALRHLNTSIDNAAKEGKATREHFDTFLMVDDDMVFELEQAQELIDYTRRVEWPASALYATMNGGIAALPWLSAPVAGRVSRWLTGLGLLAIPAPMLLALEKESPRFPSLHGEQVAFTASRYRSGKWYSEDFELCRRFDGVHLLPMAIGHLKTIPIYPDEETVRKIASGEPIPEKLSKAELDALEPHPIARNADGGRGAQ